MADIENRYHQVPSSCVEPPVVNTGRRFKATAFIGGLIGLTVVATLVNNPGAGAPSPTTSLVGVSPSSMSRFSLARSAVRRPPVSRPGSAGKYSQTLGMERLAIRAIEAIARGNRIRDLSMRAAEEEVKEELANADNATKAQVEKLEAAVQLKAKDMAGVTAPLGFFDPLGFSTDCPAGKLLFYREVELKHGRVAMLATAGILWVEGFGSIPGFPEGKGLSQMDVFWDVWAEKPNYIVAAICFFTVIEVISGVATTKGRESGLREAGDFCFNPLAFKVTDELKTKEMKNGRLAMLAAAGMIVQGCTTHNGCITNLITGA